MNEQEDLFKNFSFENIEFVVEKIMNKTFTRKFVLQKIGSHFRGMLDRAIKARKGRRDIGQFCRPFTLSSSEIEKLNRRILIKIEKGCYPTLSEVKWMVCF
jgi:hypothetical protein